MGRLRAIHLETLSFAFEAISSDPLTEETALEFEQKDPKIKCKECDNEWTVKVNELDGKSKEMLHFSGILNASDTLTCPECGKKKFKILKGRELYISEIEAKKEDED